MRSSVRRRDYHEYGISQKKKTVSSVLMNFHINYFGYRRDDKGFSSYPEGGFSCFSVTQSEQDRSCILLLRLQRRSGDWLWVHCVLQVKDNMENSQQPVIVCTNQVLR
jgi:hypothetical protein